jgi:hypothetical protein
MRRESGGGSGALRENGAFLGNDETSADNRNQNVHVLCRHSGMPLAGIQSAAFVDYG